MNDSEHNAFRIRRQVRHTGPAKDGVPPSDGVPPRNVPSVRVVSVGSTNLERRLRRLPEVELLRGGTLLEAIGELSEPSPAEDGAPVPTVLAVARHALPADEDAAAFVNAARLVLPDVRLVAISDRPNASLEHAPTPRGFDASHTSEASLETLLSVSVSDTQSAHADHADHTKHARDEQNNRAEQPGQGEGSHVDAGSARTSPGASMQDSMDDDLGGDSPLVAAALRGRALHDAAVRVLKGRLGTERVSFHPSAVDSSDGHRADMDAGASPPAGTPAGTRAVAVERDGHLHGHLFIDTSVTDRDAWLGAAWMADWLELGEQLGRARHEAYTDPLTGAWNRRYFERYLSKAMDHARTHRHALTLLVFDIDDFKTYNDRHGHPAGDEILVETVRLMRSMIRPSDRVCRIGGDEFAVIFYEPEGPRDPSSKPPASVYDIAQRFQSGVRSSCFPKLGLDAPGGLAVSGGLATFPWDGNDLHSLVARADQLALEAKKQGKNCITYGPAAVSLGQDSAGNGSPASEPDDTPVSD